MITPNGTSTHDMVTIKKEIVDVSCDPFEDDSHFTNKTSDSIRTSIDGLLQCGAIKEENLGLPKLPTDVIVPTLDMATTIIKQEVIDVICHSSEEASCLLKRSPKEITASSDNVIVAIKDEVDLGVVIYDGVSQPLSLQPEKNECEIYSGKISDFTVKEECESDGKTGSDSQPYVPVAVSKSLKVNQDRLSTFTCSFCHSKYPEKGLDAHMQCHLGNRPFGCAHCEKTYLYKQPLEVHMRLHTGVNPDSRSCSLCKKEFGNKYALAGHVKLIHSQKTAFSCDQCGKRLLDKGQFKIHMRIHSGEKPFSCTTCGKAFSTNSKLKVHMLSHTNIFACNICNKTYSCKWSLKVHTLLHSEANPCVCDYCGVVKQDKGRIRQHIILVHLGVKSDPCSVCGKIFYTNSGLKIHFRTHTGEKPYSCPICGKLFAQNISLKHHIGCHSEETPYSCSVCQKAFKRGPSLKRHTTKVHGSKKLTCQICKKAFVIVSDLQRHIQSHAVRYLCPVCKKEFNNSDNLQSHMKFPYSCLICFKYFCDKDKFEFHTKLHKEKIYSCSICSEHFLQQQDLQDHMLTHNEHAYSCSLCKKRFEHRWELDAHDQVHICSICGRKFSNVERHMKSHIQKPFSCNVCSYLCKTESELKMHILKHPKPFLCTICSARFKLVSNLQLHMKLHTNEVSSSNSFTSEQLMVYEYNK